MRKRFEQEQEHKELLAAMIAANIVNYSMCRPEKPVSPKDFMPTQWEPTQPAKKRITKAEREYVANRIRGMFNGFIQFQQQHGIQ